MDGCLPLSDSTSLLSLRPSFCAFVVYLRLAPPAYFDDELFNQFACSSVMKKKLRVNVEVNIRWGLLFERSTLPAKWVLLFFFKWNKVMMLDRCRIYFLVACAKCIRNQSIVCVVATVDAEMSVLLKESKIVRDPMTIVPRRDIKCPNNGSYHSRKSRCLSFSSVVSAWLGRSDFGLLLTGLCVCGWFIFEFSQIAFWECVSHHKLRLPTIRRRTKCNFQIKLIQWRREVVLFARFTTSPLNRF